MTFFLRKELPMLGSDRYRFRRSSARTDVYQSIKSIDEFVNGERQDSGQSQAQDICLTMTNLSEGDQKVFVRARKLIIVPKERPEKAVLLSRMTGPIFFYQCRYLQRRKADPQPRRRQFYTDVFYCAPPFENADVCPRLSCS